MRIIALPRWCLLLSIVVCSNSDDAGPADSEEDGSEGYFNKELSDTQLREAHADFDRNGDQKLSHQEVLSFVEKHHRDMVMKSAEIENEFKEEDASKNGDVSLEEHLNATVGQLEESELRIEPIRKSHEQLRADETEMFRAADANGDGVLNKAELAALSAPETNDGMLKAVVKRAFRKSDRDKNGRLSLDEFAEAEGAF